jgi:N12 class adenine-specific DNA methylase
MPDDLMKSLFGQPHRDVVDDLFGPKAAPANPQWNENPLTPKPQTDLGKALSGGIAPQAVPTSEDLLKDSATSSVPLPKGPDIPPPSEGIGEYTGDLARSLAAGPVQAVGQGLQGIGQGLDNARDALNKTLGVNTDAFLEHWFGTGTAAGQLIPELGVLSPGFGKGAEVIGSTVNDVGSAINVQDPGKQQQVGNIIANATGQLAGLIGVAYAGGAGAVDLTMLGQGFNQIEQGLEDAQSKKGIAPQKTLAGDVATLIGGPVTAIIEKTGLDAVMEGIPAPIKNRFLRGLAETMIVGGYEGAEEVAQQIVQNFATKLGIDPKTPVRDWPKDLGQGILPNFEGGAGAGFIARAVLGKWGAHYRPTTNQAIGEPNIDVNAEATAAQSPGVQDGQIRSDLARGAPLVTPDDHSSPLPTDLIQQGKGSIEADLNLGNHNDVLRGAGFPEVGKRVSITGGPIGERTGTVGGTFNVGGEPGMRVNLDDGSTYEELFKDIQSGGHSINELLDKYLPEGTSDNQIATDVGPTPEPAQSKSTITVKGKRNIPSDVVQGLVAQGIPETVARGVAAGTIAEASGNENAINPKSGAIGLGQWLGSRKQALIDRYGPNPTRADQIKFLADELKGGDPGGKFVLGAQDEASALHAYITKFMRPAAGAETDGDLKRGLAALGGGEIATEASPQAKTEQKSEEEQSADTSDQIAFPGDEPSGVHEWDRANRGTNRSDALFEGALEANGALDAQKDSGFGAHGITKSPTLTGALRDLKNLLDGGIDPNRGRGGSEGKGGLDIAPIGADANAGAAVGTAGGTAYRDGPFQIIAKKGVSLIRSADDIAGVLVNPAVADTGVVEHLRELYPHLEIGTYHEAENVLQNIEQRTAAEPTPQLSKQEQLKADLASKRAASAAEQPDMFGGPTKTAAQIDAERTAPAIVQQAKSDNKLSDLHDAVDYVLRRAPQSQAPGDTQQAYKELRQAVGDSSLSNREAHALAEQIDKIAPQESTPRQDQEWVNFGSNTGTLGIPRAEMPQVKGEHRGALVNFLQARGVQSQEERVPAAQLKPTQAEYSPAKVASWDKGNVKLSERSILVSSDGHILDGHHQWVKAKMNGEDLNIIRLSKPIRELLPLVHEFPSSHTSKGATAPAQQLSAADAIMQTDPALDWDSSERHERDALLSAIKMTHKADRLNTVDKTFAELPPRLREMVESHLRQGYAKKAREAAEAAPSKQDQLKAKMLANRPRLKDGLDERLVMESLEKGRGTAFAPDTIKWAEAHGFATVTKATKKNPATVTITEAGRKHLASIAKPGDRIEYTTARGENVGATVEGTFRTSESNQLAYNARLDSGTPTQVAHEDARRVTKTVAPESTAPEHATVGVDNRELSEIVSDYDSLRASQGEGAEQITHIFDPPAKGDIVRLNEKSRVYHKDHGWMTPAEAREKIREWEDRAVQQGKDSLAGKNKNSDKVVLSFFDLSGEWSLPWEQAGYQVWRFDIQRDPEQGDVNNFSTDFFGDWFGDFEGKDIHAILAANPCTDFASSGARHFAAKDKDGRTVSSVKLVQQTLAAIEYFKPAVWALENPVGRIEKLGGLPPWRLSFDPNDVGETYTKKTLIWGRFNADLPVAPVDPVEGSKMHKQYGGKSLATKNARSVTPEGFAYAFFLANNAIDNPAMTIANKYDRLDPKLIQRAVEFGITEDQIDEAVQDHYYQELDDDAANEALRNLPDKIAEDLRTEAAPDQKELVDWGNATGIRFEDPGVKGVDRIVEKVTTENYGSPRELKDIVRGAFVVDSTQQAEEAVAAIKAHFTIAQDKGEKAVSGGYFDHKIIIKFPDGIMGEIQVVHEPMFAETKRVRKDGLYDKWRAIPGFDQENSPPEARKLEEQMIERYAKAAEGTSFAKAFSDAMSAYAARNSFAKSVWDRIEPTFLTSPRAGTQPPLSNTKANPLPPETPLATGRPSISKNDKPSTAPHIGDSSYGAKNRLVTKDRAEELRAKLRAKLATQLNSGIDPEILSMGTELAVFHIEAGARKFADFTKAMVADLGLSMDQAKRFLRGWYNGARDMMEDAGAPVGDMDAALSQEEAQAIMAFQILRGELATESQSGSLSTEEQSNASASPASSTRADDRNSDEGVSAGHLPGAEGERGTGISPAEQGGGSGTELRSGDESGTRSGSQVGRSANDQDRQANGTQERSGENGNRPSRRVRAATAGTDFRTSPRGLVREGSWKATASRNLDIVELVKKLDAEGRAATPEEQALLAKFTGWGASEIRNHLFPTHAIRRNADGQREIVPPTYGAGEWGPLIQRASELLKGQDLEEALQSTQYAHYTSPEVIRSIWDGLNRLGFGGGKILEPGMGIGNFYMLTPDDVHQVSHYTGVELDGFTAKIAKYLLPQESVIHGDYTKTKLPNGFFDVAMGNPPFANIKILDDPDYKKHRFSLHDYFFAKSIDKVRPGGMLVFVTSRYTMDKLDAKARQYIADRADLIGAVRLPQTAFKENAGTEVVTDVLFFQKRADGVAPGGQSWLKTDQITAGGTKFQINEYYKAHPEMVLGKHSAQGSMYSKNEYTVEPYAKGTIEAHFAKALQNLPSGVYFSAPKIAKAQAQAKTFERDFAPASSKEGGLYEKGGKLFVVDQGSGIEVEEFTSRKLNPNDKAWLKSYIGLRDALKEAQRAQLEDAPDWEKKLEALNKSYRAFVKKHGQLLAFTKYERTTTDDDGETKTTSYKRYHNQRLFDLDVESPLVGQLEKITDDDEIKEGAFLQGRTLNKPTRPKIESPQDALAVTLDEVGKVDLDYAANLLGKSRADLVSELGDSIFEHPSDGWQTSDEYLSGLVIDKLEEAQAAAAIDPKYERNVEALLKVQPKPLPHSAITVKLGQSWIRPEIVKQFVSEELGQQHPDISYEPATGTWTVGNANSRWMRSNLSDFGTPDRSPLELLDALLNNRSIKVSRTVDKKTVVDPEATAAANEAAKKISDRFKSWIWTDGKRAGELQDSYNRLFNNIAPRQFNGDHLTLPGLSANFAPHPHVKRAVWRIVQTGNTYLAHAVGAGKTAEQIISGMEQKRLGLIKKPMYVVPNHMLQQFASEFLELYPAAQIMVADEKSFHTDNRRRFMAQAALNDPDAIVVTHSSFGKLGLSAKNKAEIVNDMVAQLEDALEEAKAEGHEGKIKRSKLEKQIEQVKRRIEGKTSDKDQTLNFEDMGVDFLYVDEAHEFRKLDFATNRQAKGIDSAGSAKALDLYSKARWLQKQKPNRNLVLASGTPVTNTMAELFTVMRYMDEDALERDGIQSFDAWANMFGEMKGAYEQNAAGKYELVERFSKFVNVPELMKRFRQFADVLTSDQLGSLVQRPVWKDGIPKSEVVPASTHLERYMKETLNTRLETSRKWKPSKEQPGNPDPVINIITDARLASIDMRFALPGLKDDPGSKLNKMLDNIVSIYKATAQNKYDGELRKGAVQIVFSAVGFGEDAQTNRGFDLRGWVDKRLMEGGIKKSEIAWMSDANTHAKKDALQKAVRSGQVRVLIGSPKNMGTGLNVQRRLYALHYLSPPWYPSDVEQPHGRIIRQGNLHKTVEGYWYATKGTYDSTAWGMVSRKQKFIEQAMQGDDSVRVLEDISESSQYEMAAALAAGDERIIKVAGLSGDIERLERLKGAHADQQRQLRSDRNTLEKFELPRLQERVNVLEKASAAKGTGYEPFSMTDGKDTYTSQKEAGEHIIETAEQALNDSVGIPTKELGKLYGKFPITMQPASVSGFTISVHVGDYSFEAVAERQEATSLDPVGMMTRIQNRVREIPTTLSDYKRMLTNAQQKLRQTENKIGAPFEHESELAEKIAEREQLQAEMAKESEPASAAPAPAEAASALVGPSQEGPQLTEEQLNQFWEKASRIVGQIIPNAHDKHIGIMAGQALTSSGYSVQGFYRKNQRLIAVAHDISLSHPFVLAHESVHAMRALGLFTKTEWNLLVGEAWTHNPDMAESQRRAGRCARLPRQQARPRLTTSSRAGRATSSTCPTRRALPGSRSRRASSKPRRKPYEKVVRHLTRSSASSRRKEYDVMKRKVVLDDLMWEADASTSCRSASPGDPARRPRAKIDAIAATMPKVVGGGARAQARQPSCRGDGRKPACCAPTRSRTRLTTGTWSSTMPGPRSKPRRTAGR